MVDTYQDTGCYLHPACLSCPLPRCVLDERNYQRGRDRGCRDKEIIRLVRGGKTKGAVSRRFKLSERSIYRIVNGK